MAFSEQSHLTFLDAIALVACPAYGLDGLVEALEEVEDNPTFSGLTIVVSFSQDPDCCRQTRTLEP
jgi:hypothetical protein